MAKIAADYPVVGTSLGYIACTIGNRSGRGPGGNKSLLTERTSRNGLDASGAISRRVEGKVGPVPWSSPALP
jgi:hypothetical protein